RLTRELEGFSFVERVYPSDANFLLVKTTAPREIYSFLVERGIIVRDRSSVPRCDGCLRITVGGEQENDALLESLAIYKQNTL
ncbi:MAG: aminotransferase class I/II-fold pyridoxal phosphate-dependent enzyme, partial [Bacteroidota bacterium]